MFGFGKVAGATAQVTQAIQDMLAPFRISGGLPLGFWRDPYVIGYIQGTIGMLAKLTSGGSLAGEKLGRVTINVFDNLVPGQGLQIVRMANQLYAERDFDFLRGMDRSSMAVAVMHGSRSFDSDPDVVRARAISEESPFGMEDMDSAPEPVKTGSMLQFLLFHTVVRERLGSGPE